MEKRICSCLLCGKKTQSKIIIEDKCVRLCFTCQSIIFEKVKEEKERVFKF